MSRLTFNMTLDILEGCKYSCMDCSVDKDLVIRDIPEDDVEALLGLTRDMRDVYGAEMFEFSIGPTDFITSKNGMSILEHPLVVGLLEAFDSVTIALSMLSDNGLVELADKLNKHVAGKKFRLGIPISIKNAHNSKYLDMLRKHISLLKDNMGDCEFYRIYSTVVMTGDSLERLSLENLEYMSLLKLGVWQTPEYLFGHSRARFDDLITRSKFISDYRLYVDKMSSMYDSPYYIDVVPDPNDGVEVTYRNGKLYYLPYLVEKFHWWHDALEIPKPWTAEAILDMKSKIVEDNMVDDLHSSDCDTCCHFFECNTGDVKTIMRLLGERRCLPGIRDRTDLIIRDRLVVSNRREIACQNG